MSRSPAPSEHVGVAISLPQCPRARSITVRSRLAGVEILYTVRREKTAIQGVAIRRHRAAPSEQSIMIHLEQLRSIVRMAVRESFEEHHQRHLSSTFPFAASAASNQEARSNTKPFSIEQGSLLLRTGSN